MVRIIKVRLTLPEEGERDFDMEWSTDNEDSFPRIIVFGNMAFLKMGYREHGTIGYYYPCSVVFAQPGSAVKI